MPVRIIDVLFRVFGFSKASVNALTSSRTFYNFDAILLVGLGTES